MSAGYYFFELRVQYVTVDVPTDAAYEWDEAQELGTADEGTYWRWRREGTVSGKTWDEIIADFDRLLANDAWTRFTSLQSFCSFVPEISFSPGDDAWVAYRKANDSSQCTIPAVCLAAQQESDAADAYQIVLMTRNPSQLTVWTQDATKDACND